MQDMYLTMRYEIWKTLSPIFENFDSIAISILKFFHPVMLNDFFPSPVLSDGNCLFRAVSKSIYRTEDEHFRLRLLSSLEILKHPEMYDPQTPQFHEYIKDFNAECPHLIVIFLKMSLIREDLPVLFIFMLWVPY